MKKLLKITFTLIFTIIILLGFAMPVNPPAGNWYQQFLPNIGNRQISDIFFLDSLTGWSVTNATNQANDTTFVLKTTNGGDNWIIQYRKIQTGGGFPGYYRVYFLNQSTGYTCGVTGIDKTINGGNNWTSLNAPLNSYLDMSILSIDTIWIVSSNPFTGGVFRTTNGGAVWENKGSFGSSNPSHIYMYNARIGFIDGLKRTTDAGQTWTTIAGEPSLFFDMYFADSLTGWKCHQQMKKTTDGGLNWVNQILPSGGNFVTSQIRTFSNINKDTIWAVGGDVFYPGTGNRGVLYRTTNGGNNWLYQIPDTGTITINAYFFIQFLNKRIGWAYHPLSGIHTVLGGDTNFITGITQISNFSPKDYRLFQNYPNPFNPKTNIKYQVTKGSYINLIIYDITGKQIIDLVNRNQSSGTYEVDFGGYGLSSGVYLYSLIADGIVVQTRKMILLK